MESPEGIKLIRWVYKRKKGYDISAFKVRLVAKVTLREKASAVRKSSCLQLYLSL